MGIAGKATVGKVAKSLKQEDLKSFITNFDSLKITARCCRSCYEQSGNGLKYKAIWPKTSRAHQIQSRRYNTMTLRLETGHCRQGHLNRIGCRDRLAIPYIRTTVVRNEVFRGRNQTNRKNISVISSFRTTIIRTVTEGSTLLEARESANKIVKNDRRSATHRVWTFYSRSFSSGSHQENSSE